MLVGVGFLHLGLFKALLPPSIALQLKNMFALPLVLTNNHAKGIFILRLQPPKF